jgi:cell division protein FtsQ
VAEEREARAGALRRAAPGLLRAAGALGLLGLVLLGAARVRAWALASPAFALRTLTVEGASRSTPEELLRQVGLPPGQNLFALDVDAVERALASHPWVRRAEATRRFPGALLLEVEEYAPAALLALGDLYVLDAEGVPFKRLQPGDAVDLPLVTGVEREGYVADAPRATAQLREALGVARAYREAGLEAGGGKLSEVRREADGWVLVAGEAGQEVRLPTGDVAPALSRLARVRAELSRRGLAADVIHLDNRARPGWVAVRVSAAASERSGTPVQHGSARSRE